MAALLVLALVFLSQVCQADMPEASEADDEKVTDKTDWSAIIIVCMAGGVSVICSGIGMFVAQHYEMEKAQRRDMEREEVYQRDQIKARPPHQPLVDAMRVRDTIVPSVHIPTVLSESTMMRLGGKEKMIQSYRRFLREIDEKLPDAELMMIPDSLHPEISVRRDTQVSVMLDNRHQPLNMNKLIDFVGNVILIGQPPASRRQLDLHWRAIWDEKIGCLVWIGNVQLIGDRKMGFEAYAPVDVWRTQDAIWPIGPFEINVLESFVQKTPDSHYVHRIEMSKKTLQRVERRHIWVVHIDLWEDVGIRAFDWNSKPAFIKKIVDAVSYTHYALFKKPKKGEMPSPNLLINCPSGVHQSVTFAIVYICRQMWFHRDKVRVEAVIKYVRQHRYAAWGMLTENQLHCELKIVYRSMKVIMNQLFEQELREVKSSLEQEIKRRKKSQGVEAPMTA